MSIDDLVIDLAGNKMADANNKFREIMSQRVNDALDAKKIELAKSLGVPEEEEPEITDVEDEEEIEATEEDQEDEEYEDDLDDGADEFQADEEEAVDSEEDIEAHDG
tara:strand:+ start:55 stop:375 length:321 start_codon:yes stop_codon:yes gene_type:complete